MQSKPGAYEFFDHTADAKFKAQGKTLEELFTNCARACSAIITDVDIIKPKKEHKIHITAKRLEAALFDFLDEILFLLDTEGFILYDCKNIHITQSENTVSVSCTAVGDYHKHYDVSCNVKAVTYNEMYIKETKKGYEAQVVVDL